MSHLKTLLSITVACTSLALSAQTGETSMSLEQAQTYALEHAFAVKNARLDAQKAAREVKETLALGLPQVNGSIDYNNYIDIPTQVAEGDVFGFPPYLVNFLGGVAQETGVPLNAPAADPDAISEFQFGANQTVTAGVQATQLIFDGSYFVGLQASKAYAALMQESLQQSEAQTRADVAQAYHTALVADENSRLLREGLDVLASILSDTEALFKAGFVEELDVDQLQLSLADLESRIRYADMQAAAALDLLKFSIGMPLTTVLRLTDDIDGLLSDNDAALLENSFSAQQLPEYRVQQNNLKLAELGVKLERARLMPSLGGFYTYQRNAQRFKFDFFDFDQKWYPIQLWGVQLKVPIFGSTLGKQRIEKAKIDVIRAQTALDYIAEGALLEYRSARIEFNNALEQRTIQRRNYDLAQRIFERTKIKYDEGVSTSLELTQVRNQLLNAQGNFINATLQVLNSKARLNKALNNI